MPTKSTFKSVSLYGGAITSSVPEDFIDLSQMREVPDTQEVYVTTSENSDDSLVFDLLEQLSDYNWKDAFESHISEVCRFNNVADDEYEIYGMTELVDPHRYVSLTLSAARKWGREAQQTVKPVLVLVNGLIRLDQVSTDVLLSYNMPIEQESDVVRFHDLLERIKSVKEAGRPQVQLGQWSSLFDGRDLDNTNEQKEAALATQVDTAVSRLTQAVNEFAIKDWDLFKSSS